MRKAELLIFLVLASAFIYAAEAVSPAASGGEAAPVVEPGTMFPSQVASNASMGEPTTSTFEDVVSSTVAVSGSSTSSSLDSTTSTFESTVVVSVDSVSTVFVEDVTSTTAGFESASSVPASVTSSTVLVSSVVGWVATTSAGSVVATEPVVVPVSSVTVSEPAPATTMVDEADCFAGASVSVGEGVYSVNESVDVLVSSRGLTFDLWVREPSGWVLVVQNSSGDLEYSYAPSVPGDYSVRAEFFGRNLSRVLEEGFVVSLPEASAPSSGGGVGKETVLGLARPVVDAGVGDVVYVGFEAGGSGDFVVSSADGTRFGEDVEFLGVGCGEEDLSDQGFVLLDLGGDFVYAAVPFLLLPMSFVFFFRRKYMRHFLREGEGAGFDWGGGDLAERLLEYDAVMGEHDRRGDKRSLQSLRHDYNFDSNWLRREHRDFIGRLLSYDEEIERSVKSGRDLAGNVLVMMAVCLVLGFFLLNPYASKPADEGLLSFYLNNQSYYALPYLNYTGSGHKMTGFYLPNYACSDEGFVKLKALSPGSHFLDIWFSREVARVTVRVAEANATEAEPSAGLNGTAVTETSGTFAGVSLSIGKTIYQINETVNITVSAGDFSFDLWIGEPSGWVLALQNYSGGVTYDYVSDVPGDYVAKAEFFAGNVSRELSLPFKVVSQLSGSERALEGANLYLDKEVYYVNESVVIHLSAENLSFDLWINAPTGWVFALQNQSGSTDYVYMTSEFGDYEAEADFYSGNESRRMTKPFRVVYGNVSSESFLMESRSLVQGEVVIGEPVNWTQEFLVTVLNDSGQEVCLPLPGDAFGIEVLSNGSIISDASCFILPATNAPMNLSVTFKTSPVELVVGNVSELNLSEILPPEAFDIKVFEDGKEEEKAADLEELSEKGLEAFMFRQEITLRHNSSLPYENVSLYLEAPEEEPVAIDSSNKSGRHGGGSTRSTVFGSGAGLPGKAIAVTELSEGFEKQPIREKTVDGRFGFVVDRLEKNKTLVIAPYVERVQGRAAVGEPVNWTLSVENLSVWYKTPEPTIVEDVPVVSDGRWSRKVYVESDASVHYSNVSAYSGIEENLGAVVRLLWLVNDSRIDVTFSPEYNVSLSDSDADGLPDIISWIVPQLSNQSFEIEANLTVINVQSYPTLGGNWTVEYNTTGTADLWITAVDGTTWTNWSDSGSDLKFLELRCGNQALGYEWINDSVYVANYSCNQTGHEVSKVLTVGRHILEFRFGDIVAYAYNSVPFMNFTAPTEDNGTTITRSWTIANISFAVTGASLDTFRLNWNGTNYTFYNDSLVLAFNLNNNANLGESATKAADSSQYGNNGTITGATWTTAGQFGGAMSFNGTNQMIQTPPTASLNLTGTPGLTVEAWVKGASPSQMMTVKQTATNPWENKQIQFQVAGDRMYVIWVQDDSGGYFQIWTAIMNLSTGAWSATKKTTSSYDKQEPQLQVTGDKIYYVWRQKYGSYYQIWLANSTLTGANWAAEEKTTTNTNKYYPQLHVAGNRTYVTFSEYDPGYYHLWTAVVNNIGTGWSATEQVSGSVYAEDPQLQVSGSTVYYVYEEDTGSAIYNIYTATTNLNGGSWSASKRTSATYGAGYAQLQVVGGMIYYVYVNLDASSNQQIVTASMTTGGTGFSATTRTTSAYTKTLPQLQVVGDTIYYVWSETDGTYKQIWTATMKVDGTGWTATQRTTSSVDKTLPQLQVVGGKIYYVWQEVDSSTYTQVVTGEEYANVVNKGDAYGIGMQGSTIRVFVDGGVDGFKAQNYNANPATNTSGAAVNYAIGSDWTHVGMTYDKSLLKLYINGVLTNSTAYTEPVTNNTFNLTVGDDFNGTIDEVRIYKNAISAAEMAKHYQSEISKFNQSLYRLYVNVTGLSLGTYTYYGWANESSGISNRTDRGNLRYITCANPPSFSVALISPANTTWTTDTTPVLGYRATGSEASYSCTIYLNGTSKGTNATNNNTVTYTESTALSEGNYSWNVTCTTGSTSNYSSTMKIGIDASAPSTSASAVKNDSSSYTFGSWTLTSYVNVTLSCSDAISSCNKTVYCTDTVNSCTPTTAYSIPVKVSTGGISYIRYQSNDTAGNLESIKSQAINITYFDVNILSPVNYFNTSNVTPAFLFNVSGTNGSYSCTLYLNDSSKGSNATTVNNTQSNITSSTLTDGRYYWYVNCTANTLVRNSAVRNITIDTTAPSTSASAVKNDSSSYTFGSWALTSYVNVTLSCSDSGGVGCDKTVYCKDTVNSCTPTTAYSVPVQVSTGGISYIRYRSNDTLGNNESVKSQAINITYFDVNILSPVNYFNTSNVTPAFLFNVSGTNGSYSCVLYLNDTNKGSNATTRNNTQSNITSSTLTDGRYYWYVNCTANTLVRNSAVRNITIDTTAPSTSASAVKNDSSSYTFGSWALTSYVNVTLSCSDSGGVGCDKTVYCKDTVNSCTPSTVYSVPVQVSTGGISYIRYRSNDTLGNNESVKNQTIMLDYSSPVLNFTSPTAENGTIIAVNSSQVNISVSEATTNLSAFKFNWNGTNYSIYDDSLVLALNFNNNSAIGENSTNVVDSSKYGNNLSCVGTNCPNWTSSGRFGGAMVFDGSDDFFNASNSAVLGLTTALSIEAWINSRNTSGNKSIAAKFGDTAGADSYILRVENGRVFFYLDIGGWVNTNSSLVLNNNTWYHVAGTYDGSNIAVYVNGALNNSKSQSGSIDSSTSVFRIGSSGAALPAEKFNGTIDEVRVYSRSLSAQDVWLHYQTEFAKYNSTEYRFYANLTNLTGGTYTYYGWANDSLGNSAYTSTYFASSPRYLTVSLNQAPSVSNVVVNDSDGGTIQTSVNDNAVVYCNATVTDPNGYADVSTGGGVNATLYHQSNVSSDPDDWNVHYTNSSCSFRDGSGTSVVAVCAFTLRHEALNGTWTCNVTAKDSGGSVASGAGNNSVDQLVAVTVLEDGISFGSMGVGVASSVANSTNVTNQGNVLIDIQVSGNAAMSCSGLGQVGVGNISFNVSAGGYDSMSSKRLSTSLQTEASFNLGVEGVATGEGVASTKNEYWTVSVPQGVRGVCNNTITIVGVISAD